MKNVNPKCWASPTGGCSRKLSREHIVSASFFEEKEISATGFDWTGDNHFTISLASATAKVLCRNHNQELSPLDAEAGKIGNSFKRYLMRTTTISNSDSQDLETANGSLFERWLLKTTLNVICASPKKHNSFRPDKYLIDLTFGTEKFNYPDGMGLYFVHPNAYSGTTTASNSVTVRPLFMPINNMRILGGALVTFWGFLFFLKTLRWTDNLRLDFRGVNLIDERLFHLDHLYIIDEGSGTSTPAIRFFYDTA